MWVHNMKCVKRVKESALPSGCVSWGNMLPRSMVEIKERRKCVFPICCTPPLPSPILPRVSITVSLHLSLAQAGRSFLMFTHTHTCTNTKSGAHIWNQMEHSEVYHTHTDTHTANSHVFHVELWKHGVEVSHVSVTCVKGASDKHQFPSITHIHHFLSDSERLTCNHRLSFYDWWC